MNTLRPPKIAIATGDAGGIGPEISIKSALDLTVRSMCCPILVGDPALLEKHAKACGLPSKFCVIDRIDGSEFEAQKIVVLDPQFAGGSRHRLG